MPTRLLTKTPAPSPWGVFSAVLVVVFLFEFGVMVVLPWFLPHDSPPYIEAAVDACLLTFVLAPLLWYLVVLPLQRLAEQRSFLIRRLLAGQEDVFGRLARDLHDGLGQYLTTLNIGLRTIEELHSLESARLRAGELRRIGAEAHDEIRRLARGLRPAVLDDLGLAAALERLLRELQDAHGLETRLETQGAQGVRFPRPVETALFRIVQEAASNAVRHGRAKHLEVRLCSTDRFVELTVEDDGVGFDPERVLAKDSGDVPFGLLGMQRRAEDLKGAASVASSPGGGTTVTVRLPLAETPE